MRLNGLASHRIAVLPTFQYTYYTVRVLDFLLDLIFPRQCLGCGKWGKFICQDCQKSIRFYDRQVFQQIPGLDDVFVLAHYDGVIQKAVKDIKYRGTFGICQELAEMTRKNFHDKFTFDYLVPVPLAEKRLAERGFNQAQKLAKNLKLAPVLNCLVRTRETRPQFDLKLKERKENVRNAFAATIDCHDKSLCLVDDVATTGATLSECAKALKKSGASKVFAICVARGG